MKNEDRVKRDFSKNERKSGSENGDGGGDESRTVGNQEETAEAKGNAGGKSDSNGSAIREPAGERSANGLGQHVSVEEAGDAAIRETAQILEQRKDVGLKGAAGEKKQTDP